MKYRTLIVLVSACAILIAHHDASAITSGSVTVDEPNGFPGVCNQPCYTARVDFAVHAFDDPQNPLPFAGSNTYSYRVEHLGSAGAFAPSIVDFDLEFDTSSVFAAGFINPVTAPGVAPSSTSIGPNSVMWNFLAPALAAGETSALLYVHSPLLPLDGAAIVKGQASLDAPLDMTVPGTPPDTGAVPEPTEALLVLLGLGALGTRLRATATGARSSRGG